MKILVLGTAAATAMPLAFCRCPVCREARRLGGKDIRKRSSALINDELLIDLGPDSVTACAMYGADISGVKYLLQTHPHSDHFDAGHFVTRMSGYATKGLEHLDIVCSEGTAKIMDEMIRANEDMSLFNDGDMADVNCSLRLIRHDEALDIGGYRVTAIDSLHDPRAEAMIYLITGPDGRTLLYALDLLRFSKEAWDILSGRRLDAVFIDMTYGEGFNAGGHPDAGIVREYVKRMRERGMTGEDTPVYTSHISHEGNSTHEEMEKTAVRDCYHIAYDGMTLTI